MIKNLESSQYPQVKEFLNTFHNVEKIIDTIFQIVKQIEPKSQAADLEAIFKEDLIPKISQLEALEQPVYWNYLIEKLTPIKQFILKKVTFDKNNLLKAVIFPIIELNHDIIKRSKCDALARMLNSKKIEVELLLTEVDDKTSPYYGCNLAWFLGCFALPKKYHELSEEEINKWSLQELLLYHLERLLKNNHLNEETLSKLLKSTLSQKENLFFGCSTAWFLLEKLTESDIKRFVELLKQNKAIVDYHFLISCPANEQHSDYNYTFATMLALENYKDEVIEFCEGLTSQELYNLLIKSPPLEHQMEHLDCSTGTSLCNCLLGNRKFPELLKKLSDKTLCELLKTYIPHDDFLFLPFGIFFIQKHDSDQLCDWLNKLEITDAVQVIKCFFQSPVRKMYVELNKPYALTLTGVADSLETTETDIFHPNGYLDVNFSYLLLLSKDKANLFLSNLSKRIYSKLLKKNDIVATPSDIGSDVIIIYYYLKLLKADNKERNNPDIPFLEGTLNANRELISFLDSLERKGKREWEDDDERKGKKKPLTSFFEPKETKKDKDENENDDNASNTNNNPS